MKVAVLELSNSSSNHVSSIYRKQYLLKRQNPRFAFFYVMSLRMFLRNAFSVAIHTIWILFLTVLTQIGGLVWLACLPVFCKFDDNVKSIGKQLAGKAGIFLVVYLSCVFAMVPFVAPLFGRVPLPMAHPQLKPLTIITVLLNRHYVRQPLREVALQTAGAMAAKFPGTITHYLDAGFPFLKGFPLLPHLSHNDGQKLDLAFFYQETATQEPVHTAPSPIGYGICEEPLPSEEDNAASCAKQGFWQYSILKQLMPQSNARLFRMDAQRTRAMLVILATHKKVGKLFIEPHLKHRMKLTAYSKIRFQGCQAVRHDDHIHVQL